MDAFTTIDADGLQKTQAQSKGIRFVASDIGSLVEFLAARILEPPEPLELSKVAEEFKQAQRPWRILVGIGGIPGSGKSTVATRLQAALNAVSLDQFCPCLLPVQVEKSLQTNLMQLNQPNVAGPPIPVALVGMDGFHLTRAELDKLPAPEEAHRRRGAPWTFNLSAFREALRTLKMEAKPVILPTFNHAAKDPDSRGCLVAASTRVVLVEGLYVLSIGEGWLHTGTFDITVFINTPKTIARDRVIERHVASGISESREEAKKRWDDNDSKNADYILSQLHSAQPDVIIHGDA